MSKPESENPFKCCRCNGDYDRNSVLGLVIIFGAFLILKSIKHFLVNAVVGLLILFVANSVAGLGIGYSWLVILICAIGGTLGAIGLGSEQRQTSP